MDKARKLVKEFCVKHPKLVEEAEDLYDLYIMEVENGESENNEYQLLSSSLNDLLKE